MSEPNYLFRNAYRYLVNYTAYAGNHNELEIKGHNCRLVSDRGLNGSEIALELALYIEEQDHLKVNQVVIHRVGLVID
jgi:hypothetical protein